MPKLVVIIWWVSKLWPMARPGLAWPCWGLGVQTPPGSWNALVPPLLVRCLLADGKWRLGVPFAVEWRGVKGDLFSMAKLLRFALVGMVIEGRKERTFRWTLMTDHFGYTVPPWSPMYNLVGKPSNELVRCIHRQRQRIGWKHINLPILAARSVGKRSPFLERRQRPHPWKVCQLVIVSAVIIQYLCIFYFQLETKTV